MNLGGSQNIEVNHLTSPSSQPSTSPFPSAYFHQDTSRPQVFEEKIQAENGYIRRKIYIIGQKLGRGAFAECFECLDAEENMVCAVKIVKKAILTQPRAKQKLISEVNIHQGLSHPNIVQFDHVVEDQENVYILLELCRNRTLSELVKEKKRLTEFEVRKFLNQIILGLKYLHSKNIIHRDLKLGNLFLDDNSNLKIGDFGLAAKLNFQGEKRRTVCGTPNYIAPEVLKKVGHSFEVDIWALGVIMYTLLVGRPPFSEPEVKQTYKNIVKNNYTFPENLTVSNQAKDLISKMLNGEPTMRLTLDGVLAHPFMNKSANSTFMLESDCNKYEFDNYSLFMDSSADSSKSPCFKGVGIGPQVYSDQSNTVKMLSSMLASLDIKSIGASKINIDPAQKIYPKSEEKPGLQLASSSDKLSAGNIPILKKFSSDTEGKLYQKSKSEPEKESKGLYASTGKRQCLWD